MYHEPNTRSSKKTVIAIAGLLAVVGVVGVIALTRSSTPDYTSVALVNLQLEEQAFHSYMKRYGKEYSNDAELQKRFKTYRDNAAYVRLFNTLGKNWSLQLNEFADMTFEEFGQIYTPMKMPYVEKNIPHEEVEIPSSVDWRRQGVVTGVKNQGQCGSCWSFSTTGSIEGAWALAGHTLVSLSEQQLVDCSGSYGNNGCNGGLMDNAFKYVEHYGLTSESNYPYTARDGQCNDSRVQDVVARINSYHDVSQYSANALESAIAQQPVSVAVEADQSLWQFYNGGVVDSGCGTNLDHGVLAVGYDTTASTPYYWVKNSWGSSWGIGGYIKLGITNGAGICGIQLMPSYPTV